MPLFAYKAIDAQGKSILGRVEAVNLFDLEQRLSRMGLDLITGTPSSHKGRMMAGGKVKRQDLINVHKEAANFKLENQKADASPVPYHPGAAKYFAERGVKLN